MSADSLSAGFLLALKDLEIRGAGEILGSIRAVYLNLSVWNSIQE